MGVGVVAFDAAGHNGSRVRQHQQEALLATYRCGAGLSEAFLSLEFKGTGDVFSADTSVFRSVAVTSTPVEVCQFYTAAALESLASGACDVSVVDVSSGSGSDVRSFQFVCRAGRPAIVRTVAEVSAALLIGAP
jgi:hypothetical protein